MCSLGEYDAYLGGRTLGLGFDSRSLLPVAADGSRDRVPSTAVQMTAPLQAHPKAELESRRTSLCIRSVLGGSLTRSLEGSAVDEIIKIADWKTQSLAERYIGPTTSAPVAASKRQRSQG